MADAITQFKLRRVETSHGPLALLTMDNGADWRTPTVFGRPGLESLARALDEVEAAEWAALVLTGKPYVFGAGADLREFPALTTFELAAAASRAGHELFGRIARLPFPTVAAINGLALGGGLEIALHCDARTISSAVRHVGLPECSLGIVPGWGGTQLLPRLCGPATAIQVAVQNPLRQNRLLAAAEALALGVADRLLEPVEFLDESIAFALELAADGLPERPEPDWSELPELARKARARLDDSTHGAPLAPYRALELIEGAARWSVEEGYREEERAIGELMPGPQAQASVYAFDCAERRAKQGIGVPDAQPRRIAKVGVAGAGLMATQLATLLLRRLETEVAILDLEQEKVDAAVAAVREEIEALVARGRYDEGKGRFLASLLQGTTIVSDLAGCDVVFEAVFEELDVKRAVLAELEAVVSPECLLLTNTSSLSVTGMAEGLAHPERVAGLHFFNPVAVLPLVEIVRARQTDDTTLATAWDIAKRLGKRGLVVQDAPAFVVNRILVRMTSVLLDALEHGNTVEETDEAVLRLGLPLAPSVLLQMVGPRVANHVLQTLHAAYPERFPLSETLERYAAGDDTVARREERRRSVDEIQAAVLAAIAGEVRLILEEGVVAEAADIDSALLLGAGWPFWLGGITKHLDQTGVSQRLFGRPLADIRAAAAA